MLGVVFATGASQLSTMDALIASEDVSWEKIVGLHLDECVGLSPDHPGSFRHYLARHLTGRVGMRRFYGIDGSTEDPDRCARACCAKSNSSYVLWVSGRTGISHSTTPVLRISMIRWTSKLSNWTTRAESSREQKAGSASCSSCRRKHSILQSSDGFGLGVDFHRRPLFFGSALKYPQSLM